MSFGQIIKGTILPKIALKELWEEDTASGSSNPGMYKAPGHLPDSSQRTGATAPFVKIGGQILRNIQAMTIDETGFIPRIQLTFIDALGEFAGDYFPKTDLIMAVHLTSGTEKLKPIRMDFLITGVKSIPSKYTGFTKPIGIETTYMVRGELFIPTAYQSISRSYSGLNSKEALKKISEDLGLGFAENESNPADNMTWVNTSLSTLSFIQEIAKHAYQDDDSFFSVFVDKYYYLNYIEVNRQLKLEDAQRTFITAANPLAKGLNQNAKNDPILSQLEEETMVNYLTTEYEYKNKPNYITELALISDQGSILKSAGYKKNIFYYDHLKEEDSPEQKFIDFFMTPLKSIDRSQDYFLIPQDESLADTTIKKWMNIDYGNAHPEWNAARLLNSHNLKELDKIKLKVTLNKINFQVARGFTVPVYISVKQAEKLLKATKSPGEQPIKEEDDAEDLSKQVPDKQLTGYYYVSGAKYHYDLMSPYGLYTELFLARREWAPSKNNE